MSQSWSPPPGLTDALAQHVSAYGRTLFLYRGVGRLITDDGTTYACAFAAAQLEDGTVLLLCGAVTATSPPGAIPYFLQPQRFEGTSDDGARLVLRGNIVQHNYLAELPAEHDPFGFAYVGNTLGVDFPVGVAARARDTTGADSGDPVTARGHVLRPGDAAAGRAALGADATPLDATRPEARPWALHYGLTNFRFDGRRTHFAGRTWEHVLPLRLQRPPLGADPSESARARTTDPSGGSVASPPPAGALASAAGAAEQHYDHLLIARVPAYRERAARLTTLKQAVVTAEAVLEVPAPVADVWPPEDGAPHVPQDEIVTALTYVLSVARGTKVQWVYREWRDATGAPARRVHEHRVTKTYAPRAPLADRSTSDTVTFVEQGYPAYLRRRVPYQLDTLTIDAYLDARTEDDYLELRGAKLAVALEALREAYADAHGEAADSIVPRATFRRLRERLAAAIRAATEDLELPPSAVEHFTDSGTLANLNRRSFRQLLGDMLDEIGLALDPDEIRWMVASRNSLVHRGRFVWATDPERRPQMPFASGRDEYAFALLFLDRLMLRLLGYAGRHQDPRDRGGRTIVDLRPLVRRSGTDTGGKTVEAPAAATNPADAPKGGDTGA